MTGPELDVVRLVPAFAAGAAAGWSLLGTLAWQVRLYLMGGGCVPLAVAVQTLRLGLMVGILFGAARLGVDVLIAALCGHWAARTIVLMGRETPQ